MEIIMLRVIVIVVTVIVTYTVLNYLPTVGSKRGSLNVNIFKNMAECNGCVFFNNIVMM